MSVGVLAFTVAAVTHLTFQAVVYVVVYPGLADVARTVPGAAAGLHARYTSRMGLMVAPVYGLLAIGTAAVVLDPPPGATGDWLPGVAVATSVATVLVTGLVAAPLHRSLSAGDPVAEAVARRHRRLAAGDAVRLALAVVQTAVAVMALSLA